MINVTRLPDGNLKLTADNETRRFIAENEHRPYWTIMADLFEPYYCNGSYEPFDPADGNPFVGLTDAPCIAENMCYDDDGTRTVDGNFWYFADYVTVNDLDELKRKGRVIYTLAR